MELQPFSTKDTGAGRCRYGTEGRQNTAERPYRIGKKRMAGQTKRTTGQKTRGNTRLKLKEPSKYRVIMLNDDFTPMDFVVQILVEIFGKENAEAVSLMLKVHHEGQAHIATYTYDVAVTKQHMAIDRARAQGYPFQIRLDEA